MGANVRVRPGSRPVDIPLANAFRPIANDVVILSSQNSDGNEVAALAIVRLEPGTVITFYPEPRG